MEEGNNSFENVNNRENIDRILDILTEVVLNCRDEQMLNDLRKTLTILERFNNVSLHNLYLILDENVRRMYKEQLIRECDVKGHQFGPWQEQQLTGDDIVVPVLGTSLKELMEKFPDRVYLKDNVPYIKFQRSFYARHCVYCHYVEKSLEKPRDYEEVVIKKK